MKKNESTEIDKKQLIDAEYVFIDGISRSGKGALAPFISSLKNFEHFKSNYNFDRLIFLIETNKITYDAFQYMLETDLIMDTWFTMIGRNQNTNKHDLTSILNSPKADKYLERENIKDNPENFEILEKYIVKNKVKFPYITDDFIFQKQNLKKIIGKPKFIVSIRNPIELIFAWERSGRGIRFGTDKRFLHPSFSKGKNKNVPYFAIDEMEKYHNYTSLEKCTYSIINLQTKYYEEYEKNEEDVLWFYFEDLLLNPKKNLDRLFEFTETKPKKWNKRLLDNARIPRKLLSNEHETKSRLIFSNINEKLKTDLLNLCEKHNKMFGNTYNVNYSALSSKFLELVDFKRISKTPDYINGKRIN